MKDLIAKLQMDANCALGAIWMHIDAQEKRIAELEAQQAFGIGETYANALSRIAELEAQIAAASAPVVGQQPVVVELAGVKEQIKEGAGFWHSCSGCYETEDGHPVGRYPYSEVLQCPLGNGCSECGGIGAIWDNNDYDEMARDWEVEPAAPQAADTDKLREVIKYSYELRVAIENAAAGYGEFIDPGLAETIGKEIITYLAASTALQAPVREVPEGMPVSQEPKYGIRDNRLFNRASGEFIPEDEPVFIFRARDTHAVNILAGYAREVLNVAHASAVWGRVDDFKRFWDANPDRMKQPDTALPAAPVQEPKP